MGKYGTHTPQLSAALWTKIGQITNTEGDRAIANAARDILTEVAMNPEAWREFLASRNGQSKPEHPDQAFDQRELYPPLPPVPSAPQLPLDADPWGPDASPSYEAPQAYRPPVMPQIPPQKVWVPPDYRPPINGDRGTTFPLQHQPEICASCYPLVRMPIGEMVYARTSDQGHKEYRHLWHAFGEWR